MHCCRSVALLFRYSDFNKFAHLNLKTVLNTKFQHFLANQLCEIHTNVKLVILYKG